MIDHNLIIDIDTIVRHRGVIVLFDIRLVSPCTIIISTRLAIKIRLTV